MSKIRFVKMQGLGNDFILVEEQDLPQPVEYDKLAVSMCDRHFGIGADGLIIVCNTESVYDADIKWRIINSDGSEPEMCGNGIRCFAKYVFDKHIIKSKKMTVSTLAGTIIPEINDDGTITVDMGEPILLPSRIPVLSSEEAFINQPVEAGGKIFNVTAVSMGNPHAVIFLQENETLNIIYDGPLLETHSLFPEKTNVEFVEVLNKNHVKVDVWERGCGITLACGTGACATVVAAFLNGLTDCHVNVTLPGGTLIINWDKKTNKVFMTGPAAYVFEGEYVLFPAVLNTKS